MVFSVLFAAVVALVGEPTMAEPPSTTVTVVGKRPLKPCAETDSGCIAAVAERVWTEFPNQLETFCTGQIVSKARQRQLLEDFTGEGSPITAAVGAASPLDDRLPPAMAQLCQRPKQRVWQPLAETWVRWSRVPTAAEIAGAGGDRTGDARLYCRIERDGRLSRCTVSDENPLKRGLGAAALRLAGTFRAAINPGAAYDPATAWVEVMVQFGTAPTPLIETPDWSDVPEAGDLYPAAATAAGVRTGVARVRCDVDERGGLADCQLLDEAPAALGFGQAALIQAQRMRLNLWTRDGAPTAHRQIVAPLRFNAP